MNVLYLKIKTLFRICFLSILSSMCDVYDLLMRGLGVAFLAVGGGGILLFYHRTSAQVLIESASEI